MNSESIISTFDEIETNSKWLEVFYRINSKSEKQTEDLELTTNIAMEERNLDLNRYRNVLPYDQHRVRIKQTRNENDYINASPFNIPFANRRYILTQGPLSETAAHFWSMIWEQNSTIIVMLNKFVEHSGKMSFVKCHAYFPTNIRDGYPVHIGTKVEFDSFSCELISEDISDNFITRKIKLTALSSDNVEHENESRLITHFQFTRWPDFGVPESTSDFLYFLAEVRDAIDSLPFSSNIPPITIHCSAGIGRSGAFILADTVIEYFKLREKGAVSEEPPSTIEDLVVSLRRYRMGLIQTPEQLQFSWRAIVDYLNSNKPNNSITTGPPKSIERSGKKRSRNSDDSSEIIRRKEKVQEMKEKMKRHEQQRNRFFFLRWLPEEYSFSVVIFIAGVSMAMAGYCAYKFWFNR
uniref:protein-tyrosine-phosphatase n=1 Tax=Acrobeloides nanus TaxID=290746 RepID=A0A914C5C6_9BILA